MMKAWRKIKLSDACVINASSYSLKEKWKFVNYLDTGNITDNRIDFIQYIDVENDKLPGRARRKVKRNSIIYSTVRPNQRHFGIIKTQPDNFLVSTGFAVIDVDVDTLDADFLYYLLMQPALIETFHAIAEQSKSAYPSIKSSDIKDLEIEIPELATQKKIVEILGNLDRKITQNTEVNKNLEEQAQAIFDDMFPNILNGKNTIGSIMIPKRGKGLLSKNAIFGNVPVVAGGLEPSTYHNVANTVAPVLTISASGANAGYVRLWNIPIWSSDSSFIDSSMTDDVYFWYVLLKKRQKEIYDAQTGSAHPHIYPQHIATMPIGDLKFDDVHNYTATVTPIFETIGHNKNENIRLATTRDTLLPRLMSGELNVSDLDI